MVRQHHTSNPAPPFDRARGGAFQGLSAGSDGSVGQAVAAPTSSAGAQGLSLKVAAKLLSQHSVCWSPAPSPEATSSVASPAWVGSHWLVTCTTSVAGPA